jgi:hypothetical protein
VLELGFGTEVHPVLLRRRSFLEDKAFFSPTMFSSLLHGLQREDLISGVWQLSSDHEGRLPHHTEVQENRKSKGFWILVDILE